MIQEQLFISELFKDIQDAILLILHCRTVLWFRATSSSIFTILDVRYNLLSVINSEVKVWATNRQYSFCLLILWKKVTKILRWLTWMHHVVHNTCITHGRNTKTLFFESTSILLLRKDWHSIRLDRMQSSFKKHFQLLVFQKLLDWKLEKSFTKKYTCHLDLRRKSIHVTSTSA